VRPPAPATLPSRSVEIPSAEVPRLPGGVDGPAVPTGAELPTKSKTRADFRESEFRRVIAQHGKYVTWRKALMCACLTETTTQAAINCTICDGSGFHYVDPMLVQAHMVQFDKSTRIFEKFSMWLDGKCSITMLPEHRIGFRDSIEMRDSIIAFNEILVKGNRRGIRSALPARTDTARYRIVNVTRIAAYLNGAPLFLDDAYYRITDNGWIEWTAAGAAAVPDGTRISIRYEFHPVWIIQSFPHGLRDDTSGRKSPKGVDRIIAHPIQGAAFLDFLLDANLPAETVAPVTGAP